jgi:hypothetical protein
MKIQEIILEESNTQVEENWKKAAMAGALAASTALGSPSYSQEVPSATKIIATVIIDGEMRKYDLGNKFDNVKDAEKFISDVLNKKGLSGYHLDIKKIRSN